LWNKDTIPATVAADASHALNDYGRFHLPSKGQANVVKIAKVRLQGNKQGALKTWDVSEASVCHSSDGGGQGSTIDSLG
jgi:hypothetical protein